MNSKEFKIYHPITLLVNFMDKIDLRKGKKGVVLTNFSIYAFTIHRKI